MATRVELENVLPNVSRCLCTCPEYLLATTQESPSCKLYLRNKTDEGAQAPLLHGSTKGSAGSRTRDRQNIHSGRTIQDLCSMLPQTGGCHSSSPTLDSRRYRPRTAYTREGSDMGRGNSQCRARALRPGLSAATSANDKSIRCAPAQRFPPLPGKDPAGTSREGSLRVSPGHVVAVFALTDVVYAAAPLIVLHSRVVWA